ncbi:DedA family protein [Candidatus Saccharibacteria bacterium]|jgi:membrane-associated protein|nr:DedA family protein [Candidatus Saccharibacteria bacterium]
MFGVDNILQAGGLIAIAIVIFAESALLLGLFLPGDTLLIAGGIFASQGRLPLDLLLISVAVATVLGYQVGYYLGRRAGPHIFNRKEGILFRKDYMDRTEIFFAKHGGRTLILARFVAIVRTVVPLVAGMGRMSPRKFLVYNLLGGIVWSASLILVSYWIGQRVPNLDNYIKYLVLLAIILTIGGIVIELLKNRDRRMEIITAVKEEYKYLFKKG